MSGKPRSISRRPSRSIPVTILALALIVLGGLGVWLLGALLFTKSWPGQLAGTVNGLGGTAFASQPMMAASILLALVGVVLVITALWPGSVSRASVLGGDIPGETAVTHRDLAKRIRLRTESVDGVHSVSVKVRPRRVDAIVRTVVDDVAPVQESAQLAVEQALAELRPAMALRTRVRVRRTN